MWTDHCALVTLDTIFHDPLRNQNCHTAFFILACRHWKNTIRRKNANRQFVTLLGQYWTNDIFYKIRLIFGCLRSFRSIRPGRRIFNFHQVFNCVIHCCVIHIDNCITFLTKHLIDLVFEVLYGVLNRNDVGKFEESSLHDHIDPAAQPDFRCNLNGINIIEFKLFFRNRTTHVKRKLFLHLFNCPVGVQ